MANLEEKEKGYIKGHGSVPPPQTVSKLGPKGRRRAEISIDSDEDAPSTALEPEPAESSQSNEIAVEDLSERALEAAIAEEAAPSEGAAPEMIPPPRESDEDDNTPWYISAQRGVLQLTEKLDPRRVTEHTFELGELVQCKMNGDDSWVTGHITSVDPVLVGGSRWDQVEPANQAGGEGSPAGSPNHVLTGFLDMFSTSKEKEEPGSPKPWYNSFKLDGLLSLFADDEPQKSPRHHFNEGATLKVLNESQEADAAEEGGEQRSRPTTPLALAASFLSDCSSVIAGGPSEDSAALPADEQLDLVSCLKQPDFCSTNRVKFDVVYLRQHEFVPDGSGGLPSSGIPFGLGWGVESDMSVEIDEFEELRQADRLDRQVFMMEGFVSPKERSAFATAHGTTKEEVSQAELATFKANRRRRASLAFVEEIDS